MKEFDMANSTPFPGCCYITDHQAETICGDKEAEPYRGMIYVCDQHRFLMELEARRIATRHYRYLSREVWNPVEAEREERRRLLLEEERQVYYIGCGEYIKIGVANSPRERLRTIREVGGVLSPHGLDLSKSKLLATEFGGIIREHERHEEFAMIRARGEWFHANAVLMAHIDRLRAAPLQV